MCAFKMTAQNGTFLLRIINALMILNKKAYKPTNPTTQTHQYIQFQELSEAPLLNTLAFCGWQ